MKLCQIVWWSGVSTLLPKGEAQRWSTHALPCVADTNTGEVEVEKIVGRIVHFAPADIEYLFRKVRQLGFEREYARGGDFRITTDTFLEVIPQVPHLPDR